MDYQHALVNLAVNGQIFSLRIHTIRHLLPTRSTPNILFYISMITLTERSDGRNINSLINGCLTFL